MLHGHPRYFTITSQVNTSLCSGHTAKDTHIYTFSLARQQNVTTLNPADSDLLTITRMTLAQLTLTLLTLTLVTMTVVTLTLPSMTLLTLTLLTLTMVFVTTRLHRVNKATH